MDTPSTASTATDLRQIIVIRTDLQMTKGKMIAQGAHASLAAVLEHQEDPRVATWLAGAFAKICVRVDSEEHLLRIVDKARLAGLITREITDNGRTQFHGTPTLTCAAIGPATPTELAPVTGDLRLL